LFGALAQVTVAFNKDPSPVKVNLGVGAYRTEVGGVEPSMAPMCCFGLEMDLTPPRRVLIRAGREAPRAECGPARRADAD